MLSNGSKLGPYEIVGVLGSGGMGEVYRARDTRLGRDVAVKILPQRAMEDADARQRFEREARAISSLNHPHICALYDVGNQDGTEFLVMELLDGQTLARRLERGPVPTPELLRIAIDLADALADAHRHGVLHRDLKPLNIMLTKTGAKLMDFGLAKAPPASGPPTADASSLPTRTMPLTTAGTIVGTFQYISPEQLHGREADVRSDLFSFGAVLYEMATGSRAFDGQTTASVIAAVLERTPPPITSLQPLSPPALDRIVGSCLDKDPDARVQSAHDLKLQLEWMRDSEGSTASKTARRSRGERTAWIAAGLLAAAAAALGYAVVARRPAEMPAVVAQLSPPAGAAFALWGVAPGAPALSPDGTQIAFVAQSHDGKQPLWVRRLDSPDARAFDGTDGASRPFWSSDGKTIAYFRKGKLCRVDAGGGPPVDIADVGAASGGTWSRSGDILISAQIGTRRASIVRLAASGGASTVEVTPGTSFTQLGYPQFLPDGHHFLFSASGVSPADQGLYVSSLDNGQPQLVLRTDARAWYAAPGYVLFVRNGTLMADPFDLKTLQVSDDPTPVAENVEVNPVIRSPILTVSNTGTLVFNTASATSDRIVWYDRSGSILSLTGTPGAWGSPSISPDGRRLALSISDAITGSKPDIWVYDLGRGVKTRVTSEPGINTGAFWAPDDKHVCFLSNGSGGPFRMFEKPDDGTGAPDPLIRQDDGAAEFFGSWSADGRYLAFQRTVGARRASNSGPASGEIWAAQISGDQKPFPVVQTSQFVAIQPALSPDAKWLAYVSDESGQSEVYVVPFPRGTGKYLVSSGGGIWPRWSRDGTELFYWQGRTLMSVSARAVNGVLTIGRSDRLFESDPAPGGLGPMYDVSADGKRFVVVSRGEAAVAKPLTVVLNWPALLRKR